MFISSTVYHAMANHTVQKYVLRIIDHSMIYVAISGTYTPILLNVVGGWLGWTVFILLWGQQCGAFCISQLPLMLTIS